MKVLRKLLLTLIVTIVFFAIIEGAAWIYLSTKPDIYQGDLGYLWSLKPNIEHRIEQEEYAFTLKTNSLGFRDKELSEESDSERWLFMGCSTSLGWGVEQEEGFIDTIDKQVAQAELINGGQPGWTTQQGLMEIERFKELKPTHVFIGFGVRDSQFSYREDREARPSPWILSLNIMKTLAKMAPKKEQKGDKRRVSPEHFERNLKLLEKSFSGAKVHFYSFPQLNRETEYEEIITDLGGKVPTDFYSSDFFEKDTIHLNQRGHQKLAEWFVFTWISNLVLESKKPEIENRE